MPRRLILAGLLWLVLGFAPGSPAWAQEPSDPTLRTQAYQHLANQSFPEAIAAFQAYLDRHPDDLQVGLDFVSVLTRLQRRAEAVTWLERLHQAHPAQEPLYFQLGTAYVELDRKAEADRVFRQLEQSTNPAMARAAADARQRLQSDQDRQARYDAETKVYQWAEQGRWEELLTAAAAAETRWGLSFPLELQRLYALYNLQRYAPALEQADRLWETNADSVALAFLRAELLVKLDRTEEAKAIWRQLQQAHGEEPAAIVARERLLAHETAPEPPSPEPAAPAPPPEPERPFFADEAEVFELAEQQRHGEVVEAVAALETKAGSLSWPMELQRLYAWQALGDRELAWQRVQFLSAHHPDDPNLALIRADLLAVRGRIMEAGRVLRDLSLDDSEEPVAQAARERLRSYPPIARMDKWYWGEAYLSGDYYGRFGAVVGSGLARHGYFIPKARWLQPYAEFRFGVDTESGVDQLGTVITDNHVGFYGGMRAQLWPTEYLFLYAQGGVNKDLLDRWRDGDWSYDYQAGAYGFKSWGPGVRMLPGSGAARQVLRAEAGTGYDYFWRGDWFVDAGANFSYYHRYASAIGYGQAHEGYRLFQLGPTLGFDAYAVENVSWDIKGNYFDNFVEVGPGLRWLWTPCTQAEVILRTEWLFGYYMGRDDLDRRGNAAGQYDELRVGLSVGMRW